MTTIERIDRLAKKYDIDYSHVKHNFSHPELSDSQNESLQNMASTKLVAIWGEFEGIDFMGYTIIDSFLLYAKQHIKDKSLLRQFTYSLLEILEADLAAIVKMIETDKKKFDDLRRNNMGDYLSDPIAEKIFKMERYQCTVLEAKGFIKMEIDNFNSNPSALHVAKRQAPSPPFIGMVWVGKKRLDLVNLIYQTLKIDCIDPSTKYGHFEKLFSGISLTESFVPINWIHQGGASSLCFLFYLLTKDPPLISSTSRNKVIAFAFTVNQKRLKPDSLRTSFSKINSGNIPTYYNDLETRINKILRSAKS